jgi:hypothetical protein
MRVLIAAAVLSVVVATAVLSLGCGSQGGAKLISVGGTVLLDGEPVKHAAVTFHHDDGSIAYAVTNDDGSFLMTTRAPGDGVVPGSHTVTVALTTEEGGVQANEHGVEDYHSPIRPVKTTYLVPKRYSEAKTSPLAFEIDKPTKSMKIELTAK